MFFPESERIAEQHSDVSQVVQSLDQLLSSFAQGGLVQTDLVATAIGVSQDQLIGILDLYTHAGLLQSSQMIRCPNCSTLMKDEESRLTNNGRNHVTCTSCEMTFEAGDQEFVSVYVMLKPSRSNPLGYVKQPKVVFALHGINTYAEWHRMFSEVVGTDGWKCRTNRWYFGKFSVLRFLIPRQRSAKVSWFRKEYDEECNDLETGVDRKNNQFPSIVAHSFGTYILGNALLKYDYIRFNKVILCGSILPIDFPWEKILERGQVQHVRNDYGSGDVWSKRVRFAVRGSGPSGLIGFSATHERLSQFEYSYEHSEYFDKGHVRANWLPFLNEDERFWPSKSASITLPKWRMPLLGYFGVLTVLLLLGFCLYFGKGVWQFTTRLLHHTVRPSIDEPTPVTDLANVFAEPDFPAKAEVLKGAAKPQHKVAFTIQNKVARPLKLILFNCFAHYNSSESDPNVRRVPFVELPLPAATDSGPGLQPFSQFPPKFSYYGFYIIDSKNGAMTKVGFVDLTSKSDWFLLITETGGSLVPEWTNDL